MRNLKLAGLFVGALVCVMSLWISDDPIPPLVAGVALVVIDRRWRALGEQRGIS